MSDSKKEVGTEQIYEKVISVNEGTTKDNIKSLFIWYDLFGFSLTFQLLFVFAYLMNLSNAYTATIFSVEAIIVVEEVIKNILAKDAKSFERLKKQLGLVKLWTVPLVFLGVLSTFSIFVATFGYIF